MVHGGTVNIATGASFSGGVRSLPALHAEARTTVPVATASRPIDRMESSQPDNEDVPRDPTGFERRHDTRSPWRHVPEPCQSHGASCPQLSGSQQHVMYGITVTARPSWLCCKPATLAAARGDTGRRSS